MLFRSIVLRDVKAKTTTEIEADVVLPMLGFVSDIGALAEWGLSLATPVIVKYRDSRTDTRTELEAWIR